MAYVVYLHVFQCTISSLMFHFSSIPGLIHLAAKIKQDRSIYKSFALAIKKHLVNNVSKQEIISMINEAVSIERDLIQDIATLSAGSLTIETKAVDFEGLKMKCFSNTDSLCEALEIEKLFEGRDPMPWIDSVYNKEIKATSEIVASATPVKPKNENFTFTISDDF
jgi:hypothetical protein